MNIDGNEYLQKLKSKKDNGRVKVLTGLKGIGKSFIFKIFKVYLLSTGVKETQIITVDFNNVENIKLQNPYALFDYITSLMKEEARYYIFIDEIQNVKEVQNPHILAKDIITFVDVLLSFMKKNADVYISGSNSRMLSKDIPSSFRDRADIIQIFPLSFKEFNRFDADRYTAWKDYCFYGGLPKISILKTNEEKIAYLKDVIETASATNNSIKLFKEKSLDNKTFKEIEACLDTLEESFLVSRCYIYNLKGEKY